MLKAHFIVPLALATLPAHALASPVGAQRGAPADAEAAWATCDPDAGGASDPQTVELAGWLITVDGGTGAFSVTPPDGGPAILSSPGTCVVEEGEARPVARVATGEPLAVRGFGAWRTSLTAAQASAAWSSPTGAAPVVDVSQGSVRLTWALDNAALGTVSLTFSPYEGRDLKVGLTSSSADATAGELAFACGPSEGFFGLGSQVTGMDLRGHTYPLWTQEQGIGKFPHGGLWPLNNTVEAAYAPMGIWHTTGGQTAIVAHDGYWEADLCETVSSRVHIRSFPWLPEFVLVAGATPKARLANLTGYTGRLTEPARWTFAPWNDAVGGPERLWEVAGILRDNDIPSSAIWSEDWIGDDPTPFGFGLSYAWEWDPETYPELPLDVRDLHREGFAFLAYFNTFVPKPTRMWDEGQAGGYLIEGERGRTYTFLDPFFRPTSLVDLTNPDARDWVQGYLMTAADELKIDGWMADFSEWLPHDAVMASGETGWEAHNRYPLDWQRANREVMEDAHAIGLEASNNWTFFARSGWASLNGAAGGIAPTMWAGDQNTDWNFRDGYPTVVPIGAHLGLAGVSVFGHDVAGFTTVMTRPTNKELFWRWAMLGAFSPLMRTHHGMGECDNWTFDRDEETLVHFRRYASIHALLFPYLWSLAGEAQASGLPIMRHPWLVEPGRPGLWEGRDYVYFLGDDLLIAPVLEEGQTRRSVELPGQGWWPLFATTPNRGEDRGAGGTWEVNAPASPGEIPVYVRPGAAVPLLGQVVDSFYGATTAGVSDLADVERHWAVALYPDEGGGAGPVELEDVRVWAEGMPASVNWGDATVDGAGVPTCAGEVVATCAAADGSALHVLGDGAEVAVGRGRVFITAESEAHIRLGHAGATWGEWAASTPLTDLDPDVTPPCHDE